MSSHIFPLPYLPSIILIVILFLFLLPKVLLFSQQPKTSIMPILEWLLYNYHSLYTQHLFWTTFSTSLPWWKTDFPLRTPFPLQPSQHTTFHRLGGGVSFLHIGEHNFQTLLPPLKSILLSCANASSSLSITDLTSGYSSIATGDVNNWLLVFLTTVNPIIIILGSPMSTWSTHQLPLISLFPKTPLHHSATHSNSYTLLL